MRKDKINCLFGQTIQEKHLLNCIQCTYSSRRTRGGGVYKTTSDPMSCLNYRHLQMRRV